MGVSEKLRETKKSKKGVYRHASRHLNKELSICMQCADSIIPKEPPLAQREFLLWVLISAEPFLAQRD